MSTEVPTADNPESASEVQETPQFNSLAEAAAAVRASRLGQEPEPVAEEPEAEAEEVTEPEDSIESTDNVGDSAEEPAEETETEEAEESEDVLSQVEDIDFDSLPTDVQDAIAEKLEVKSHKAFAEMRTKLKAAESELSELREAKSAEVVSAIDGANQFSSISDADELKTKVDQAQLNVDHFTNALLRERTTQYDSDKGEDVSGIMHDGKFYSQDEILAFVDGQKSVVKDAKARQKQVKTAEELRSKQNDMVAESKAKLGISADSKASEEFDKLLDSQGFKTLQRAMPSYAKELIETLGQAAAFKVSSKEGKVFIPRKGPKGKTKSISPTSPSAAAPSKTGASAQIAALTKRLQKGLGSKEEALQIARQQRSLRKNS